MTPSNHPPLQPLTLSLATCTITLAILLGGCAPVPPETTAQEPLAGPDRTATLRDLGVRYQDFGSGDHALVLVHGWASTIAAWQHQLPGLAELGRVLAIDLPGHGASDRLPTGEVYGQDLMADAIAAVLDHAHVTDAVVVGHSNGTPVALHFYRRYPQRVLGLVAVDGALINMVPPEALEQVLGSLRSEGYRDFVGTMIAGMSGTGLAETEREALVEMALSVPQRAMVETLVASSDPSNWSAEPIAVPLLALLAEQPAWNDDYRAEVESFAPAVEWQVWSGVSHFLMLERPVQFRQTIAEFLAKHDLLSQSP